MITTRLRWIPLIITASLYGYPDGSILPKPDLVRAERFTLRATEIPEHTELVLFFYTASWCPPCKHVGATLTANYPELEKETPKLLIVTYPIDDSTRARADYLRETAFPWPALSPELLEEKTWRKKIEGGTPQFQAFAVVDGTLLAISAPGDIKTVLTNLSP